MRVPVRLWRMAVRFEYPLRIARRYLTCALAMAVAPLRRLPGSSATFGPPRRMAADALGWAASRPEIMVRSVSDRRSVTHALPPAEGGTVPSRFLAARTREIPATYVVGLPQARVWGREGVVIAADDTVLADLANRFVDRPAEFPVFRRLRLGPVTQIAGAAATIAGMYSGSYYHWMLDLFPRLHLLRQAGLTPPSYIVNTDTAFQRECLDAAGIPPGHRVACTRDTHLRVEELWVPSPVGATGHSPADSCGFVRNCFAGSLSRAAPFRRLYVGRGDAERRRVVAEPALVAALSRLGFEAVTMSGRTVAAQARLFSEAAVVVAPHGAALTNLLFCQPGAVVVELFDARYTPVCYWTLSETLGLRYRVLFAPAAPAPPQSAQWADIRVDLPRLMIVLAAAGVC